LFNTHFRRSFTDVAAFGAVSADALFVRSADFGPGPEKGC
jgi:hypothetical protein